MSIEYTLQDELSNQNNKQSIEIFKSLIQTNQYIGETISIDYEAAILQIHDHERQKVGGIPALSFLIATRVNPNSDAIDFKEEDSSFILLRVLDSAPLHNHTEAERIRTETAQRVSGEIDKHWDENAMDTRTRVYLGYAGIKCRIIGTFYLDKGNQDKLGLKFGSDLSNFYPNRGLKIYKPTGGALAQIVNYIDPNNLAEHKEQYQTSESVNLGCIRYASTNRNFQNIDDIPVNIYPADLLSQKSALFGMTRTGKSNTTKIIAKSVYELRYPKKESDRSLRIGQLIFDPNGEYANENTQDSDNHNNPNALKNVWKLYTNTNKNDEIVTYGITSHPNDQDRKLMLLNFYEKDNLQIGKQIIDSALLEDQTSIYVKNFTQVLLEEPHADDRSATTRYNRQVLAYRSILKKAGFNVNKSQANIKGLFNAKLKEYLNQDSEKANNNDIDYKEAEKYLAEETLSLDKVARVFEILDKFIRDPKSNYQNFESWYMDKPNASGDRWADEDLKKLIGIFQYPNGIRKISGLKVQHSESVSNDYAKDIYDDLCLGKLVIIDQSSGNPQLNKSSANRVMTKIFSSQQKKFINSDTNIPEILIYIEEAHNILPAGTDLDLLDIWVRTAKEGAKYRIGMVYATQEVSSIQKNILRNTANWFIAHLNNTDETKELCKYYDFADFESSIRRVQDKGFLRVKTLSNPFVIPVQISKFNIS